MTPTATLVIPARANLHRHCAIKYEQCGEHPRGLGLYNAHTDNSAVFGIHMLQYVLAKCLVSVFVDTKYLHCHFRTDLHIMLTRCEFHTYCMNTYMCQVGFPLVVDTPDMIRLRHAAMDQFDKQQPRLVPVQCSGEMK